MSSEAEAVPKICITAYLGGNKLNIRSDKTVIKLAFNSL